MKPELIRELEKALKPKVTREGLEQFLETKKAERQEHYHLMADHYNLEYGEVLTDTDMQEIQLYHDEALWRHEAMLASSNLVSAETGETKEAMARPRRNRVRAIFVPPI